MRIWIDLANSPHVPFFRALIPEFVARGHHVELTARDFAQTVYLADFVPDPAFAEILHKLGVASEDVLVVARPAARDALYHRFENELFDELIARVASRDQVKMILLPRTDAQRAEYEKRHLRNMIMPRETLDGANLIAAADLVISAGGTMNREAAALGIPAVS